jgi:hypothetical protein
MFVLCGLTFEVTPPAEVGAVSLGCEHSTKYRSPGLQRLPERVGVDRGVRPHSPPLTIGAIHSEKAT